MAKWSIDSETLTNIANAVRAKRGTSSPIQVDDLADEIALIDGGGLLRDKLVIPDKYNTGCHGQLKKFDPTTDTSGVGWRNDVSDTIGIDFNKPASTQNLTDNQIIVFQDYDFTTYKTFSFMNMRAYTTDKSYYKDNLTFVFINCLFIRVYQNGAIPQDTNINFIFCNCTANKIGISGFVDRCLLGNVTFFQSIRGDYVPDGDPLNPSSPFVIKNSYIMDVEAHTTESGSGHIDGLQISTGGGHNQLVYNCRFECFDMPYDHSQGGWSYSMFWEGSVTDSAIMYCIFHGGGYYGTSLKKADNQILRDNLISGEYHMDANGSESQWNRACYPNENNWQMSDGWADYISTLLVSSVWVEDNTIKICYSNDMHSERTLRIVDNNNREFTVTVPACPIRVTAASEGITQWSDLPFDLLTEIPAVGVDSIQIYDGNTLIRSFDVSTAGSIRNMTEKTITQNGTYTASTEGLDGYSKVNVSIDEPTGTLEIDQNGTFDVAQYANALVNVASGGYSYLSIQDITPTEDLSVLEINFDINKTLNALLVYDTNRTTLQTYTLNDFVIMSAPTVSSKPWQACCGFSSYNGTYNFTINDMPTYSVDTTLGVISLGPKNNYYWRTGRTYRVMIIYSE